jgi:hypothetical protein
MELLKRAFLYSENNSMLLLARSKQTMHSFISAVKEEIGEVLSKSEKAAELKVIRVNSILSNSETKILLRLCDALKLRQP